MLSPELVLKFQQTFKQLQINAGLGIDENNIDKVSLIVENLNSVAIELYYQVHPMPDINENALETVEIKCHENLGKFFIY